MITITPAYGRDYKSKKAAVADFEAGKDFVVADVTHEHFGRYCNKEDLRRDGVARVNIRYKRLTMVAVHEVK